MSEMLSYSSHYSRMYEDPQIIALARKQLRIGFSIIAVIGVIMTVLAVVLGIREGSLTAGVISAFIVFLVFAIVLAITILKTKLQKTYEGVVKIKKKHLRLRRNILVPSYDYRIIAENMDGKKKKIKVEKANFDYFEPGDRFMYHPGFPNPLEKYDKDTGETIVCAFCSKENDIHSDTCSACHKPLLK